MAAPVDLHWVQRPGTSVRSLLRPATLEQALDLLAENPDLQPVAGGTDLMLDLARDGRGPDSDAALLDMTTIAGFGALDFDDPEDVVIGAGVTHADILASPAAHRELLPLAQACLEIGSPQLRNRATIAGNVITASPANDTISALVAMGASISVVGTNDQGRYETTYPITDFYAGFRQTVLTPRDLVEAIHVPKLRPTERGLWVKAGLRKAQAISVVHAGFVLDFAEDGAITSARIALGSVGPTVELSANAADVLVGKMLTPDTIAAAATAAADSVTPIDDGRATADYRRDSVVTVVSRALTTLGQNREDERWPHRVPLLSTRARSSRFAFTSPAIANPVVSRDGEISVTVNGTALVGRSQGMGTLLEWLRETAGTGTKEGCAEGECGACTVTLNNDAVMSCLVPAAQADGAAVTTIEGLATAGQPHLMQQTFVDKFAVQCGFCIPGFVMAAQTLADELESVPSRAEIELALSGNLCRCTGYYNIIDAVQTAIAAQLGASS